MKVEHITLLGLSVDRDTQDIALTTLRALEAFRLDVPFSGIIPFPETDLIPDHSLQVMVTLTEEGAMFNIEKSGRTALANVCQFSPDYLVFDYVKQMARKTMLGPLTARKPYLDLWLYTIPQNPFILTPEETTLAGEVEFYIWYQLYLSWKRGKK